MAGTAQLEGSRSDAGDSVLGELMIGALDFEAIAIAATQDVAGDRMPGAVNSEAETKRAAGVLDDPVTAPVDDEAFWAVTRHIPGDDMLIAINGKPGGSVTRGVATDRVPSTVDLKAVRRCPARIFGDAMTSTVDPETFRAVSRHQISGDDMSDASNLEAESVSTGDVRTDTMPITLNRES